MSTEATSLTGWDLECMAWHEAGHAVCSMCLPEREAVMQISIEPGNDAFGFMRTAPRTNHNGTRESFLSDISVELSGVLAERMFLRRVTTSGGADLQAAYQMATDMVLRFGMGRRTGLACPGHASDAVRMEFAYRNAARVDTDVRGIIRQARRRAERVLRMNAAGVGNLAELLLAKRTLEPSDWKPLEQAMKQNESAKKRWKGIWSGLLSAALFLAIGTAVVGILTFVIVQALALNTPHL